MNQGSCHCQAVQFEVLLLNGLNELSRCNCSMCAKRGSIMQPVPLDALTIVNGGEALKLYQFNTKTAEHYFCSHCGIYTHHKMRSRPDHYSINIACLDGVVPSEFDVPTTDGVNHSCDRKGNA